MHPELSFASGMPRLLNLVLGWIWISL